MLLLLTMMWSQNQVNQLSHIDHADKTKLSQVIILHCVAVIVGWSHPCPVRPPVIRDISPLLNYSWLHLLCIVQIQFCLVNISLKLSWCRLYAFVPNNCVSRHFNLPALIFAQRKFYICLFHITLKQNLLCIVFVNIMLAV